jgi:hypothetical protein
MGHAGESFHAILGAAAALRGLLLAGMGAGLPRDRTRLRIGTLASAVAQFVHARACTGTGMSVDPHNFLREIDQLVRAMHRPQQD